MRTVSPLLLACVGVAVAAPPAATGQRVHLVFEASEPRLAEATAEYVDLWREEGERIVEAMERVSGLRFALDTVPVTVIEAPSWAGSGRMGMRASYPSDTKRATLVHELGHLLIGDLIPEDGDGNPVDDHHRVLFLFLYDVWVALWGPDFADAQVAVESRRRGIVDYEGIWRQVLANDTAARARELRALLERWR